MTRVVREREGATCETGHTGAGGPGARGWTQLGPWGFRREPNVVSNIISIGFLLKTLYSLHSDPKGTPRGRA